MEHYISKVAVPYKGPYEMKIHIYENTFIIAIANQTILSCKINLCTFSNLAPMRRVPIRKKKTKEKVLVEKNPPNTIFTFKKTDL